ncbi:hypothetical protein BGZ63DRAFT_346688 [Mariannaea sp. PMI_226]|nr:hypothetical protein BGZ63DRAFT_346688 [Mariannaea sp. PMI_226]
MTSISPKSTPKRKRGEDICISPARFSFELPTRLASEDGNSSPRSTVALKFRGLALDGGGGASDDDEDGDPASEGSLRKRQRPDEVMMLDTVTDSHEVSPSSLQTPAEEPQAEVAKSPKSAKSPRAGAHLQLAYPSINRLSDPKSRVKKRASSPPLRHKRLPRRVEEDDDEEEVEIVDPVRAALTWHEDEITIYDPEDEDDDGTGINGIGFKPTPALAHARAMKRRQQMAEYRKREESEARARRNRRRRGGADITIRPGEKSPSRKVRFIDSETPNIMITTG